ncbi:uncharacterized protein K452DRAFT_237917 [Aplosporella prunicola CBS 121167]|uniref:AMP-dependent synthetase/ligase domain-containing protein n=1 Tax=Aplosporella prunicola CBS 121167 TaxID=1176127 RepID=A0A6A6AYD4_9PEZI|nr:uncharacterized protein K452DRAFT_237917 [Aplosporella prunicola CBS 121167]KAF2136193.1 hypothetical protein K452DRAFT_237917 [Aplosporella prunicola CBS 121167]
MAPHALMSRDEVDETILAEVAEACKLPTAQIEDVYACTPQQLDQIAETRSEMFQIVLSFSLAADIDRWCEAVRQVVSLNSVLRTRIVHCRLGIVQVVTSEEHVTERRSGDVEEYLRNEERLGFGVPLFRSVFIGRTFVATMHHAVMDYWSLITFLSEDVAGFYLGHPPKKHPPFKDFVTHCMSIDEPAAKSFWASRFKGAPAIFPRVDPDFPTNPSREDKRKITLKRIGNGPSPSHIPWFAEAAWALTAATYADSESVAYGLVLSGRSSSPSGVETTLGPTVVEVPVQVNLQRKMTVERLIKDRATSLRQLTTNSDFLQYGTPRISAVSEAAQTASRFQSLFNIIPPQPISLPTTEEESQSVRLERVNYQARGSFSLMPICRILDGEVSLETKYDPAVICDRQLHRILNQFEHTLQSLIEAPLPTKLEKLHLLNSHDRSEILSWNASVPEITEKCVHEIFSAQARAQPEAVAVEASDGSASYAEMDQMSDRLAHELRRMGVSPGKIVAFIFEKSLWTIVAILGTLKAGGVCVPIDKDASYDRKAATFSKVNTKAVLTSSAQYAISVGLAPNVFAVNLESISKLPDAAGLLDDRPISPEDLAYISFTSGSTGSPKSVMLEHRSLVSKLVSLAQRLDWKPDCRMLQLGAHVSNSSIYEIFGALLFGGCLCIPLEEVQPSNLPDFIKSARVNWALLPPSVLRTMTPSEVPGLKSLLSIGEQVEAEASETWGEALRFFNGWGACEASIVNTVADLTPRIPYPDSIGTPVGCAVWIVNPRNVHELVPIGSVGELLIEGPGVAKGYLDDHAKTAASFVPPPVWSSSCPRDCTGFYRSGDLARYNPDGSISFIGRLDNRVKISGQTVQLEEVESAIASCSEVKDVVALTKIAAGRTQLVAIVCLADPQLPRRVVLQELSGAYEKVANERLDAVRTYARSKLSVDKTPTLWVAVEQLPRTTSQKLDRAAVREWLKTLRR